MIRPVPNESGIGSPAPGNEPGFGDQLINNGIIARLRG